MKLIENIKNYIGRLKLNREATAVKKKTGYPDFNQASYVGIIYNAEQKENEVLVNQYASDLRAQGKKVFMLGYVDAKQLPANKKFLLNSEFFWREKLDGFNLPLKGQIGQFLQQDFDILLNLYQEALLPMQAISVYSKAKFKVGAQVEGALKYYDVIIDTGSNNSLKYLIEQIDFYLRKIK
jgi:hypothetical protein